MKGRVRWKNIIYRKNVHSVEGVLIVSYRLPTGMETRVPENRGKEAVVRYTVADSTKQSILVNRIRGEPKVRSGFHVKFLKYVRVCQVCCKLQ